MNRVRVRMDISNRRTKNLTKGQNYFCTPAIAIVLLFNYNIVPSTDFQRA